MNELWIVRFISSAKRQVFPCEIHAAYILSNQRRTKL